MDLEGVDLVDAAQEVDAVGELAAEEGHAAEDHKHDPQPC